MKGRNVAAWTVIGLIPIVNIFSSILLQGSTNLKASNEIKELKKRIDRLESID
tara:strand:- start:371 stop:529 length:159 start_codon:yes stop_codon:yes gene_type:complete